MREELMELMGTFALADMNLLTEDECPVAGSLLANALHMTCDGYQEEVDKYYLSDDNKIISDTMRVSFFARTVDDAVEKLINKIKQFNPEDWKSRVKSWMNSIEDASIKAKAGTFLV